MSPANLYECCQVEAAESGRSGRSTPPMRKPDDVLHECGQSKLAECAPPVKSFLFRQLVMLVLGKDGSLKLCT